MFIFDWSKLEEYNEIFSSSEDCAKNLLFESSLLDETALPRHFNLFTVS